MAKRTTRAKAATAKEEAGVQLDIPMPTGDEKEIGSEKYWISMLDESADRVKKEIKDWTANLERYDGAKPKLYGISEDETVNVNVQFYTTEQKIPQLFFQNPDLKVLTDDDRARDAVPLVKSILKKKLGVHGANTAALMEEVLRDVLVPAGIGPTKIGYEAVRVPVDVPVMGPDPQNPQQQIQMTDEAGKPLTKTVPKVIYDNYYWMRVSPADLRLPKGLRTVRYDEGPWIAMRFDPTPGQLEQYGLDAESSDMDEALIMAVGNDRQAQKESRGAEGYEIWYKASLFDSSVKNPLLVRQLVIICGGKKNANSTVIVHRNSPYQQFGENGEFVKGMKGFPIHVLTVRGKPESAYPKSDCSVIRDMADEKCLGRSQMIQQRRRNLPLRGINAKRVGKDVVERIERGEVQSIIPFNGPIDPSNFADLAKASFPHENFAFDKINQTDIDRLSASGANQQGVGDDTADTATEATYKERAHQTRLTRERIRVVEWYAQGVAKYFALFQLFAQKEQVAEIVGEDGASKWQAWTSQNIAGDYTFEAIPDSAARFDASYERNFWLKAYNLIANDPLVAGQRAYLLQKIFEASGMDASRLIGKPPAKGPEEPRISISLKGEDLAMPTPNVIALLAKYGIQLQPPQPAPAPAAPGQGPAALQHPGAVRQAVPLDKHEADRTGRSPGAGMVPPQ